MADTDKLLAGVPLFARVPRKELKALARRMRLRQFDLGQDVVTEGAKGYGFYLIVEGEADVVQGGRTLRQLGPGDAFGEMALIDDAPRSASVFARTHLSCLTLTPWEFKAFVSESGEAAWALLETLVARVREAEARAAAPA